MRRLIFYPEPAPNIIQQTNNAPRTVHRERTRRIFSSPELILMRMLGTVFLFTIIASIYLKGPCAHMQRVMIVFLGALCSVACCLLPMVLFCVLFLREGVFVCCVVCCPFPTPPRDVLTRAVCRSGSSWGEDSPFLSWDMAINKYITQNVS